MRLLGIEGADLVYLHSGNKLILWDVCLGSLTYAYGMLGKVTAIVPRSTVPFSTAYIRASVMA